MNPVKSTPIFLLSLAIGLLGSSQLRAQDRAETGRGVLASSADRVVEMGYASWYNKGFHGARTAAGETYDHGAMTAAHPTLPFNTMVRITRTDTGKSVVVRINDRMGAAPKHVIDLSGAAAEKLDMLESGIAHVEIRIVSEQEPGRVLETSSPVTKIAERPPMTRAESADSVPRTVRSAERAAQGARFTLQIGAFTQRASAQELLVRYPNAWISEVPGNGTISYRVFHGRYADQDAARSAQDELWNKGQDSFLRTMTD